MTVARACPVLPLILLLGSCRGGSPGFPETPLGHVGHDWLAAHNRGEGHAAVHFTMVNRGSAVMSGAQMDSAVRAQVEVDRAHAAGNVEIMAPSESEPIALVRGDS